MDDLDLDIAGGNSPPRESAPNDEYDVLGLDKPIKLSTRAKIAKIDNTRIFNPQTGLNYITRNHGRVKKAIHKNEKAYSAKKLHSKSDKLDLEYDNLSQVLQFYQLWCHGLFPKAPFKDCIHLIRLLGSKSPQLNLYRRELIEHELNKLRVEKGIIDDADFEAASPEAPPALALDPTNPNLTMRLDSDGDNDDDWDFMNKADSNGLFVGEDFEPTEPNNTLEKVPPTSTLAAANHVQASEQPSKDQSSENEDMIAAMQEAEQQAGGHIDENDDDELMLMREFD